MEAEVTARDREVVNRFQQGRTDPRPSGEPGPICPTRSPGWSPHPLTDPKAGPLIAVKLHVLTRKTLGGLETDLDSRVLGADGGTDRRAVCRRGGGRFRRRRGARLPVPGGHLRRGLHLLRAGRGGAVRPGTSAENGSPERDPQLLPATYRRGRGELHAVVVQAPLPGQRFSSSSSAAPALQPSQVGAQADSADPCRT